MKKVVLLFLLMLTVACGKQTVYVRKEIHSQAAQADVRALNVALDSMKKLDCTNPSSWYYQGAMHWIPDSIGTNPLCPSYQTVANVLPEWDKCTHTKEGHEKIHFLVWHRMYIWHFEKIVRKLSGYDQFALPYWGYTDNQLVLQELFRDSTSALYESARFDSLNAGYPLDGEILRALDITKLMSYTSYEEFNSHMNAAPHGAMHDYIGHGNVDPDTTQNTIWNKILNRNSYDGLMGWVPTAGFDPVFWTHHSQIDRLWQQWSNSPNGRAVTLEMLESHPWTYVFFDENGTKIEYTPTQVLDIIYDMDYKFDDTEMRRPITPAQLTRLTAPLVLDYTPQTPIKINGQITDAVTMSGNVTSEPRVILSLEMAFDDQPSGVYEVYINHTGETYSVRDSSFVGFMSFFEAHNKKTEYFDFAIPSASNYKVTIYKHNGKTSGNLRIERLSIIQ
jgi:hypothetical protein